MKFKEFITSQEDISYKNFLMTFSKTSIFNNFICNYVEKSSSKTSK